VLEGDSCDSPADSAPNFVFERQLDAEVFFRGNTHTHTERSFDSVVPISDVLAWYKNNNYDFVVLTDHDRSSVPGEFPAFDETGIFVVIAGEEVTSDGITPDGEVLQVHVNSICSNGATVGGTALDGVDNTLKDAVDRVIDTAGAIPQVNHPNFHLALRPADILFAHRAQLIEIANQHPLVNNLGDKDHITTEQIWDAVLSEGMEIYGVASDDTHTGPESIPNPPLPTPPGKGWIQVAASELSADAICEALETGSFYASTGVELAHLSISETRMQFQITPASGELSDNYVTTFIGNKGSILHMATGLTPMYELSACQ